MDPAEIEALAERAAIVVFDDGLACAEVEDVEARDQSFVCAEYYCKWLADYLS
jgi:hypothetical protein